MPPLLPVRSTSQWPPWAACASASSSASASDLLSSLPPAQAGYAEKIQQLLDQKQHGKSPRLMLDLDDLQDHDENLKKK